MPYSKQRNSLLEREKEFLFVSISLEYKRCHFHFRRIQYYIRISSIFFLSLPHKFQALLRYEFIGNLIKILKCIILLCKHCTTLEMEREQMRLPINQMNIDVDYNKYKQTNLCKMYRIIDEKMVANSPINADFFNAYTTHTSVTAPYFFYLSFKIYGYSQSTKWRHLCSNKLSNTFLKKSFNKPICTIFFHDLFDNWTARGKEKNCCI